MKKFLDWDKQITHKIVSTSSKRIKIIEFIALSGNAQPWLIASVLFFVFDIFMSRTLNLFQAAVIAINAAIYISIKLIFNRIRPSDSKRTRPSDSVSQKFLTPLDFQNDNTIKPYSFPSGHTARAMCFAMIIILFFPKIGWFFILWALSVGFARIALGIHYLSDILGGITIGSLVGLGGYFLFDFFDKLITPLIDWFPHIFS